MRGPRVSFSAGGAGQNTMRRAQTLLPPGATVYFGCVGEDDLATRMRRASETAGVNVRYMIDKSRATGTCATLLSENRRHRSMVAHLSAAQHFNSNFLLEERNMELIDRAKIYYVTGFILPVSPDSAMLLAKKASESKGKLMTINLSAPFVSQYYYDDLIKLFPFIDIVFGNEQEAKAFAKRHGLICNDQECGDIEELKMIAKKMAQLPRDKSGFNDIDAVLSGNRLVVITQGADPTIVSDGNTVSVFPVEPAIPDEDIVTTNGAGDAFVAGFLSQILCGKTINEAISTGHALAGTVIRSSEVTDQ